MSIRAVIFDLDGVITDTAHYHFLAWRSLADSLGVAFDEQQNEDLKGLDRLTSLEHILNLGGLVKTQEEKLHLADVKNAHYLELVSTMSSADILPGAEHLLQELREKKQLIGLASASKNAFLVLEKLGLVHYFDYIVDAQLIKNSKPHPEVFLNAASNLYVMPDECIGIEDSTAGIQAIKTAGMYAIGIGDPVILYQADQVFNALTQLDCHEVLKPFERSVV